MAETGGELSWLEQWYRAQCDGDWEHEWGVRIATLDNPGWTVAIGLEETTLSGQPYERTDIRRSDSDWVMATVFGRCLPGVLRSAQPRGSAAPVPRLGYHGER
ncbi:conserved hypothetical protein [Streptomyces viridochromogenes DSM 40736]|uniref:Immunity protein 53 of polymorphic toxin system n=1 Tax=Streptomyces viridochromogenes (strain DSM 40736 / JCM 4977 / BCRC 1201 / Tue 494) TaxID=591159 RepID=D9WYV5_STRVT|nr:conserved hypothetical protein [Streptomyces viridochromogenes DSM 40736]